MTNSLQDPKRGAATPDVGLFGSLESLRGICAMMIVIFHVPWATCLARFALARQSWLFVDVFFVISGFVITHVYIDGLREMNAWKTFARRRFFRLYPLHIVTTLAALMLTVAAARLMHRPALPGPLGLQELIATLFLVHGLGFFPEAVLNAPSWSVSTEAAAYVCFAGVCLATATMRWRVLGLALLAAASLLVIILFADATLEGDLTFRLFRCLYGFGVGACAWWFTRSRRRSASLLQWPSAAAMLLLIWLSARWTSVSLLVPPAAGLLVAALTLDERGTLARALTIRPLLALGQISYSVYLVHVPLQSVVNFVLRRVVRTFTPSGQTLLPTWLDLAMVVLSSALVIGVSLITFRLIEQPARNFGRRRGGRAAGPDWDALSAP